MMRHIQENSVTRDEAARMPESEREGKIIRGVLADRDIPRVYPVV